MELKVDKVVFPYTGNNNPRNAKQKGKSEKKQDAKSDFKRELSDAPPKRPPGIYL